MLPIISLCALGTVSAFKTNADVSITDYYTKFETITNGSFNDLSSTYASNNFSGWSLVNSNTKATTMIIDVEKNYSQYENSTYCISTLSNPGTKDADKKILMINSANKNNNPSSREYSATSTKEGYKSSNITLKKNSYYVLQASFKTDNFPGVASTSFASIYLTGLKDEDGNNMSLSYEMLSSSGWETTFFFISTGNEDQTANLELWLGSKENESFGVAFFDAIYLQHCSENIFYDNYYDSYYKANNFYLNSDKTNTDSNGYTYNYYGENQSYSDSTRPLVQLCEFEKDKTIEPDINLNFEKDNSSSNLVDWKIKEHGVSEFGNAKVIDINSSSIFSATTGYTSFPGSNFGYQNEKALALWTNSGKTGYASVVSKNIEIKANQCYKFTALAKISTLISGSFSFEVRENDSIISNFPALDGRYTLDSVNSTVSSVGSNDYLNKYAEVEIFIQGHDLYDTSVNIVLSLGNSTSEAEGCVVVDDIKVTRATYKEYENANTKLKFNTIKTDQSTLSVPNGYFNTAYNTSKETLYPLTAANWTLSTNPNSTVYSGVINLFDPYFEALKANYDWASTLENPAKNDNEVENVYMMFNPTSSYQSITSGDLSISKGNYYVLSLDYKTIKTSTDKDANLIVNIYDGSTLIYTDTIGSSGNWAPYKAYVYAGERATSLKVTFAFGTKNALSQGYAFIDNVSFETTDSDHFDAAARKSDLSSFMINLDPTNSVSNNISQAYGWTTSGTNGEAGVIKGKNNDSYGYRGHDSIDDGSLENNVLILTTNSTGEIKLTSNIELTLNSDAYYKLTFKILTSLPDYVEDEEITYGAKVLLTNMEETSKFITANDGWKEITMYFHNEDTSSATSKLEFSLTSSDYSNFGYAYLTDVLWSEDDNEKTLKSEFENVSETTGLNDTVFTFTHAATENNENNETEKDNETENKSQNALTIMLYVSSAITGLAIVIAIIAYTLRKIKIKKVTKTSNADYDRRFAISQKAVTIEAEKIRRAEEKEIEGQIADVQAQIKELEDAQKPKNNLSRENGKITKGIEREFKSYAAKRSRLQDKLNMFNEKLENVKSPEYMLSLEKKVSSQMMRERRETSKKAKRS